jgi:predicted 3-demethylubiquinone-9 3-methyltransferase (glyoxalase superfamily)
MQKITPFLWYDGNAEEAANFYISIFKNSKMGKISRYGDAGPGPKGSVMSVTFQIEGQEFFALNGGPHFKFTPAISFFVNCETQQEVDDLWERPVAWRQGSRACQTRNAGHAANDQNRYPKTSAGGSRNEIGTILLTIVA